MYKIGLITEKYHISHRTLRYWEEAGILCSYRGENNYRYYDENNLKRIKQILTFRKLNLPIKDIEAIFNENDLNYTVDLLKKHLQNIKNQENTLKLLSFTLEHLIGLINEEKSVADMFINLDALSENPLEIIKNSSPEFIEKGVNSLSDDLRSKNDLRIVNLPRMIVASISKVCDNPEDACWKEISKLIEQYQLDKNVGFRNFGFGYQDDKGNYVYELWVTIPEDFVVSEPFKRKEFLGGLYAALPAYLGNIGERWDELNDLVLESTLYIHDTSPGRFSHYLEECLDIVGFNDHNAKMSERQLDLLLPIRKIEEKSKEVKVSIQKMPIEDKMPEVLLAGSYYEYKNEVKPWKKSVPWYKLAQSIYKVGDGYQECIFEGNNTFTIVYGKGFYMDKKNGQVERVFGAVQLLKSFPNYPNDLHEYILHENNYLVFTTEINPQEVHTKKLSVKALYDAAREYLVGREASVNADYCIERDYRTDGRYVDKIELYIPLI